MSETVFHIDRLEAPRWMTTAFEETPEGFLKGRAVVTTTGIYSYKDKMGKTIRELRLPEEVFKQTYLDSLKLIPLTLDHPKKNDRMVNATNIGELQVGVVGSNPATPDNGTSDNYNLSIDMIIHRKDAVSAVKSGKRGLSVGYRCDLEDAEPNSLWCGQPYDKIQRNLVANHIAIVDVGRAGDTAYIRMDGMEEHIQVLDSGEESHDNKTEDGMAEEFKVVKLDGVEYKAEAKIAEALHLANARVDSLQSEKDALNKSISTLEAEKDVQKERADALAVELETAKKDRVDSAKLGELVKARVALESFAKQENVVVLDGMDDLTLMTAIVKHKSPKAVLEGKDAVYIKARFDSIVEDAVVAEGETKDASTRAPAGSVAHADSTDGKEKSGAERYRENLLKMRKESK